MIRVSSTKYRKSDGEVLGSNSFQWNIDKAKEVMSMVGLKDVELTKDNVFVSTELENDVEIICFGFRWINDKEIK